MDQELRETIITLLKSLREKPSQQTLVKVLNAPFTLTIVGGIVLAIISGIIAQCSANIIKEREQALELYRQKQAFVASFTTNLEKYLELTWSLRKRGVFLKEWQNEPEKIPYSDGRTFDETRTKWEEEKRYWLEHSPGSPVGVISTARILFRQKDVNAKLNRLSAVADQYSRATNYLITIMSTCLVPLMANESRDSRSDAEATPTPGWDKRAHVPPDDPWNPPAPPPQRPAPSPTPNK